MDIFLNCEKGNTKSLFKVRVNSIIMMNLTNGIQMLWPVEILKNAGVIDKLKYEKWRVGELATLDSAFNCKMKELRGLAFHIKNQLETYTNTMRQYKRTAGASGKVLVISENKTILSLLSQGFFVDRATSQRFSEKKRSLGRYYYNRAKQKREEIENIVFTREARMVRKVQA